MHPLADSFGSALAAGFHVVALFLIGATITWGALSTFLGLVAQQRATLDDILLLFIFLELGAMVGIYFRTRRLPVRFLLYIAMTALTRYMTVEVKILTAETIVAISFAILLLAAASLVAQVSITRFCAEEDDC